MARRPRPFTLEDDGSVTVALDDDTRSLLSHLPGQLVELLDDPDLDDPDPALRRLSPPAYVDDAEAEEEFQRFTSDDLATRRREHLLLLQGTCNATRLEPAEAGAWLTALNSLRLYLGTSLDVSEETELEDFDEEGDRARFVLLHWLGEVQDALLSAVAGGLPAPRVADDHS